MIAPDSNRSATARSITTRSPLSVEEVDFGDGTSGYATDGTPVDCVRFADLGLVGERPDLIVSGINHGANLGDDITYSGTVAAALEGIILGIPAIAVSQQSTRGEMDFRAGRRFDFSVAAGFAAQLVGLLDTERIAEGTLINVNCPAGKPTGVEVTHLGKRLYNDELKLVSEDDGSGRRQVPDLRLRAVAPRRGGLRPDRDRRRPDRRDAGALRPHRSQRLRPPPGLGPGRAPRVRAQLRHRRRRMRSDATRAEELRAQLEHHNRATTSSTTPRSATTNTTRCSTSCARSRSATPSCGRPTRRPSASAPSRSSASSRSSTPSRCSRSATRATRTSCGPGRRGSATCSSATTSPPSRSATRPSRRSTASRSPSPTKTGS